jgi:hypothetical protein
MVLPLGAIVATKDLRSSTLDFLKPLTIDGQNTLVQVETREVGVSAGQDEQPVRKDTPSTSDLTVKKKRNRGRARNGGNESVKQFIAEMTDGIQYSATIVAVDARVSAHAQARVQFANSFAEGRLDISKHPQLRKGHKVSVLLVRKFPDKPSWVEVALDPVVHGS